MIVTRQTSKASTVPSRSDSFSVCSPGGRNCGSAEDTTALWLPVSFVKTEAGVPKPPSMSACRKTEPAPCWEVRQPEPERRTSTSPPRLENVVVKGSWFPPPWACRANLERVSWQATEPVLEIERIAQPGGHVPLTRRWNAVESRPSSLSALRLVTLVAELVVNGAWPDATDRPSAVAPVPVVLF